ncbi:MAG: hypothetical protein KC478_17745, partial [Bacteriovoracaceae bacterium]|nr:hypothetical protein [Bacteriovoracaceae bacterium]
RIEKLFSETPLPVPLAKLLEEQLQENNLLGQKLAIRSSGIDEDSTDHSFAGMFSSYLFQEKFEDIELSLRMCWASAYGTRALEYRRKNGLSLSNIKMGVVLQKMINSSVSGVMFTRNPMDAFDRENIIIDSLFGQCEGLVSGLLDADNYIVSRTTLTSKSTIAEKESQLVQAKDAVGLETRALEAEMTKSSSLSEEQVKSIAQLGLKLEKHFQMPLDVEWAIEDDELYIVQSRPITTLPVDAFYSSEINGTYATLWDNSNIVESFSGVTTPLTFSGTKKAYAIVYRQTCRLLGVPEKIIEDYDEQFENMLGLIKGRVYYNLINWYKLLLLMPGSSSSKSFMETMMGVKEDLHEKHQKLFDFVEDVPKYGILKKLQVFGKLTYYFFRIDSMVAKFSKNFDLIYQEYNSTDFTKRPLKELKNMYIHWEKNITYNWKPPIINDFLVMIFFGALKSMTEKWIKTDQDSVSLQNDLLCGQGDLDSALPVKTLMKIAGIIDKNEDQRQFIQNHSPEQLWTALQAGEQPEIYKLITDYLHLYGFRCNNEQK